MSCTPAGTRVVSSAGSGPGKTRNAQQAGEHPPGLGRLRRVYEPDPQGPGADGRLELGRGTLGDDPAVVDDRDPGGQCPHPFQRLLPEVREVVDDAGSEHLIQPIQFPAVAQVAVQRDQLPRRASRYTASLWPGAGGAREGKG